ncbi:MAG TPA: MotA/TolQ/ExbB proton channel family protein, partial [Armatimonadota bacterium]
IRRIENLIASGDWQAAIRLLDDSPSPYTRIAKASLMQKNATEQEITDLLTLACDAEIAAAASSIPVLGTIGNIAPFIGLFGTVIGIMKAFAQMSTSGGSDVIMKGVAEALIATAAGLAVGIVSVVANNWCNAWLERYRLDLERFSTEWSYLLQSLKREDAIEEPVA